MSDAKKNGEDYQKKIWIWPVVVVIAISGISVMAQIFFKAPWQYL